MAANGRDESRLNDNSKNSIPVPNRIFVGGISDTTNEEDLRNLFSKFGHIRGTKVVFDKAGIPRGYGFVTFETDDEAQTVIKAFKNERLILKERKLNIAQAIKKQANNRIVESNPETNSVQNAPVVWPMQPYSRSTSGLTREAVYYPQAYPLVWPQFYLDQQYPYPAMPAAGFPQYVYPLASPEYPYQSISQMASSDFSDTSSADSGENTKNRAKPATTNVSSDYDRNQFIQAKTSDTQGITPRCNMANVENPSHYLHSTPIPHLHPVFKTINGVTVMTYPSSFVMGNPAVVHVKDVNSDSDSVSTELGYLHSPIASGTLTPPPTPIVSFPCDFNANSTMDSFRKN